MCSILTISNEFYNENYAEVVDHLFMEDRYNPHGVSMLIDNNVFIQTTDVDVLTYLLESYQWSRTWIHLRFATSKNIGINYNHGFYTRDRRYMVMHNGIISNTRNYPVDSMWICDLIDDIGVTAAVEHLTNKEDFCNTFIIDVESMEYFTIRSKSGSLFTDNKGNYSTHRISSINTPVHIRTNTKHNRIDLVNLGKRDTYLFNEYLNDMEQQLKLK